MSRGKPNGFDHSGPPAFEPLVDFEFIDLQDKPVPQTEWLCLGWIPKRRVTLLYGPDNTGKTPLAQQLQTATALGSEWLGMKVERVRSFGLYCEDDVNDIHARQAAINQYYQCEMLDLELMRAAARLEANSNALIDFSDNDEGRVTLLYHQLEELCADEGVQLLILDPLAELFIGDQNNPTHARRTIRALNRLAVAIDGYVILTGHPSRAGQKSDGSGDSGSVQWSATGRSRLYLKRPEQEKGGEPVDPYLRRLERRKATYASIGDFIDLRWDNGVFVPVNPPASGIIGAIQRQNAERILIDFVAKTTSENQWLSVNKNAGNFAPRVLMDRPTTERGGFGREDFTRAMQSALSSKKLVNEEYGRPGDRRYRLAVNIKEVSA